MERQSPSDNTWIGRLAVQSNHNKLILSRPTTYSIRPWRCNGQPCFDRTTDLFLKPQIDSNAFNHRNRPITLNNLSSNILRLHKNFEANLSSLNEDQERRSALRRPLDAWIDNKGTTTSLIEPSIRVDRGKLIGIDLIVLEGYQGFVFVLGSTRKCRRKTQPNLSLVVSFVPSSTDLQNRPLWYTEAYETSTYKENMRWFIFSIDYHIDYD